MLKWLWNILLDTIVRIWAWLIFMQVHCVYLLAGKQVVGCSAEEILRNWGIYRGQSIMSGKSLLASGIDRLTGSIGYRIEKIRRKK